MTTLCLRFAVVPGVLAFALAFLLPLPSAPAKDGNATPSTGTTKKCTQFTPGSKNWKRCMGLAAHYDNEDRYYIGLTLAQAGDYEGALDVLRMADQTDPRVLTYLGFATRKLGDMEGGMDYYGRALAADPNSMLTREYLGEAYLEKGDLQGAKAELTEIGRRCGGSCETYVELARAIRYSAL